MNNTVKFINDIDSILNVKHIYCKDSGYYKWSKSYKDKNLSFIYKVSYGDCVEMYDEHGVTKIKNDGFGIAFLDLEELSSLF